MSRRGRGEAGRASGAVPAIVATALAALCALVVTGCTLPGPEPGPRCGDPADAPILAQGSLQERLDTYGLWSSTWDSPPTAANLGRPAPLPPGFDPHRKIWLTSILLAPGVSGRVSILTPGDARLFVASSWDRMGSLTALDLQLGATRSVDLVGCEGITSYPALTILGGPECVVFAVQQEGDDRVAQIPVPFFGAEC